MAYIALYRKYRSQSFEEVQGQEAVTTTLRNQIAAGKSGHAYLFYGARGCGKTSTARLLARALNCVAQDGPTPDPCGKCRLCTAIRDGSCMDVIEMDAASETGIDDVREKVIENVQYAPGEARFKVYIIDEVHDLSSKAFDALLKTLEEPPAHVVFVLATTEYHKVPITIRSRCQSFQFKRGSVQDLGRSVQNVVTKEGYSADPDAIEAIARSAEGSWRDALSILEQVLAYSDGHLTAETVHRAVGTVGIRELAHVSTTLADGCWSDLFDLAADLLDSGADVRQLLVAMQGHLRDLMLLDAGGKQAARELGAERVELLKELRGRFTVETLLEMSAELSAAERELRTSNLHRWILERTLARMQALAQGRTLQTEGRSASLPVREAPIVRTPMSSSAVAPTVIPKPPTPARNTPAPEPEEDGDEPEELEPEPEPLRAAPPVALSEPPRPEPSHASSPVEPAKVEREPSSDQPSAPNVDHRFAEEVSLEVIQRAWKMTLKRFEKASPTASPFLQKADVTRLEGKTVYLSFRDSFAHERINKSPKGKEALERVLCETLKTTGYRIQCILESAGSANGSNPAHGGAHSTHSSSGSAVMETGALLEAPVTTENKPTRLMDFDLSAPPPNSMTAAAETARQPEPTPRAEPAEAPPPAMTGMLAETLDIFGGAVIRSEPLS